MTTADVSTYAEKLPQIKADIHCLHDLKVKNYGLLKISEHIFVL